MPTSYRYRYTFAVNNDAAGTCTMAATIHWKASNDQMMIRSDFVRIVRYHSQTDPSDVESSIQTMRVTAQQTNHLHIFDMIKGHCKASPQPFLPVKLINRPAL